MARQVTRWATDTCSCQLEYAWDDTETPDARAHTGVAIVRACPAHQAIDAPQDLYDAVIYENRTKNIVMGRVLDFFAATHAEVVDGQRRFLADKAPSFVYDEQRVLRVAIPGLTRPEKAAFEAGVKADLGLRDLRIL